MHVGAKSVEYLGHIINEGRVVIDPKKIQAFSSWPELKLAKQVRAFLRLAGYYQ